MSKFVVLKFINLVLAVLLGLGLIVYLVNGFLRFTQNPEAEFWVLPVTLLIGIGIHSYAVKILDRKSPKVSVFKASIVLAILPLGSIIITFLAYFLAADLVFAVTMLGLATGSFIMCRDFSKKLAFVVASFIVLFSLILIKSGFEEDYCESVPSHTNEQIVISEEDREVFKAYNFEPGDKVMPGFWTHMKCHQNFDFWHAVQDQYLTL